MRVREEAEAARCGGGCLRGGCMSVEGRGRGLNGLLGKGLLCDPPSLFQQSGEPLGWYRVLKEASSGVVHGAPWKE